MLQYNVSSGKIEKKNKQGFFSHLIYKVASITLYKRRAGGKNCTNCLYSNGSLYKQKVGDNALHLIQEYATHGLMDLVEKFVGVFSGTIYKKDYLV